MKLRLTQKGFEQYTGLFGIVEFKDGVSVDHVNHVERNLLRALVACEEFDDTQAPAEEQRAQGDESEQPTDASQEQGANQAGEGEGSGGNAPDTPAETQGGSEQAGTDAGEGEGKAPVYTREQLEKVADAEGIAGLRKIAEQYGVKANSIAKLIDEIINASAK
jgi:hypothetical protein